MGCELMMFERCNLSSFQGAKDETGPVLLSETYPNDVAFSLGSIMYLHLENWMVNSAVGAMM